MTKRRMLCVVSVGLGCSVTAALAREPALRSGSWRAWLDCPGGELPFGIELHRASDGWRAEIVNGGERITVPRVEWRGSRLVFDIDHYDSTIVAKLSADGARLDGEWQKASRAGKTSRLPFHATVGAAARFSVTAMTSAAALAKIHGRWSVRFADSEDPAIGLFATEPDGTVTGTFMTTTGDYRFLAGVFERNRLRLSCFDGAHAFLFAARLGPDGTLKGDFWSRDTWHDTWTAKRDPTATLPDAFTQTRWAGSVPLDELVFPDLDGRPRSLADPVFAGKARIIEVFGSWCPNCHDEADYLTELDRKYGARGLSIVGLAFELSGDLQRDTRQVRRYVKRHNVTYPVLIAGVADKATASKAFPVLDRIRSYPTTIFMDAQGDVRAVYTGFSGPATGNHYQKLRRDFEEHIEALLALN